MKLVGPCGSSVHTKPGEPIGAFTLRPARVHDADGPSAKRRTEASATGRDRSHRVELLGVEQLIHPRLTDTEHVCGLPHCQQQLLHPIVSSLVLMLQLATLSARRANKAPTC